ncbi:hypothetical protein EZJ49_05105 [Bdellovibrio bacteriovorus]|uniref:hypothetical protein n=1 Tax=Bdellovibrio bacteriovorus TaxID=959 RepID=UPI0021CF4655|nr:hypothetical protein [Bdellovibrio bacteriovorus]UXR65629.1 hypothetical protein EZJ49_05105 [Bdellovibrio bacteriovorus]
MQDRFHRWIFYLIPLAFMLVTPWIASEAGLWIGYGKHLWHDWHFLYQDNISLLPTDNNITSSWLPALIYFGLYKLGGIWAVAHFHHLSLLLLLGLIYRKTLFTRSWPWPMQDRVPIYILWLGAGIYFSFRPNLLALIPFFLAYNILDAHIRDKKALTRKSWLKLVILQIVWVNTHGSFVILPLLTGWYLFQRRIHLQRTDLGGMAAVAVACLFNPYGWKIIPYVLQTQGTSSFQQIEEWASVFSWVYPTQTILFWSVLAFFCWRLTFKDRSFWQSAFTPLLLLPFAGLRLSVFAFIALPLFLKSWLPLTPSRSAKSSRAAGGGLVPFAVILTLAILGTPYLKNHLQLKLPARIAASFDPESIFGIAEKINEVCPARCPVYNDFSVGGFLLMATDNPLFIDGRVTPFTAEAWTKYHDFLTKEDLSVISNVKTGVFAVLSSSRSISLINKLKNAGFTEQRQENSYVLLYRSENIAP